MPEHSLKHLMNVILFLLSLLRQVKHSAVLARTMGRAGRAAPSFPHRRTARLSADPERPCWALLQGPHARDLLGLHGQPRAASHGLEWLGMVEDTHPVAGFGMMPCWRTPTLHRAVAHTVLFLVTPPQCFGTAQPEARLLPWCPCQGCLWQPSRRRMAKGQP